LLPDFFGNKVEPLLEDWIQLCFQFDSFSYRPAVHFNQLENICITFALTIRLLA